MERRAHDEPLVIVTGSAGLIGTRVVEVLAANYRIAALDLAEPGEHWPSMQWYPCDLTSDQSVSCVLGEIRRNQGGHIASVVHLAAHCDFSDEPSRLYEDLTVQGTRRLLQGLRQFELVEQLVYSSSLLVMKPVEREGGRLTEYSPIQAEWAYPKSKLKAERLLFREHGDIPLVILRLAGVYDEDCRSLPIAQHIRRVYERQVEGYVFPGDVEHGQPFVHLDDAVLSILKSVERRSLLESEETFLIAEPEVVSYADLQEALGELIHGCRWPTTRIPKAVARVGAMVNERLDGVDEYIKPWMIDLADDHYPVEIHRARERLDWEPRHRLSRSLPEIIDRFKRNPRKWYRLNKLPYADSLES